MKCRLRTNGNFPVIFQSFSIDGASTLPPSAPGCGAVPYPAGGGYAAGACCPGAIGGGIIAALPKAQNVTDLCKGCLSSSQQRYYAVVNGN